MTSPGILEGAASGAIEVVFLLGADEIDTGPLGDAFVIYQGHHGDRGATRADVILPGAAYTEKNATYVNTEGRPQRARLAVFPPGEAKEDWKILRALSESAGPQGAARQHRPRCAPAWPSSRRSWREPDLIRPAPWQPFGRQGRLDPAPFVYPIADFYRTDPISRSSTVMAECSALHARADRAGDRHLWLSSGAPTSGRRSGS